MMTVRLLREWAEGIGMGRLRDVHMYVVVISEMSSLLGKWENMKFDETKGYYSFSGTLDRDVNQVPNFIICRRKSLDI